jgi:RNA-directed DNA polymerase
MGQPVSKSPGVIMNVSGVITRYDKELERRKHKFVRYADDSVILVKSVRAGNRVRQSIRRCLENTLKLKRNEAKSRVLPTDQLEYVGFVFKKTTIRWSEKAFQECKKRKKQGLISIKELWVNSHDPATAR